MNISIASGKGGTGKTTIATNLSVALGSKARLLDCDVDFRDYPLARILMANAR